MKLRFVFSLAAVLLLFSGCSAASDRTAESVPPETENIRQTENTRNSQTGETTAQTTAPAETEEPEMKTVYYRDFGAVGDGKHDDLSAIASAHTYANRHGLPVRAEEGATYYIASTNTTAEIRTDTDWSGAFFIIDDSALTTKAAQRAHHVFEIAPSETPKSVQAGSSVQKGQTSFALNLSSDVLLILTDDGKKQYIREGKNANSGSSMSDITVVRKDGSVRPGTEVVWDFAAVTSAVAKVMEAEPLTVRGGTFTTIANRQDSASYFNRGIHVTRTNVVLDSITHLVEGEGKASAPYYGFLNLDECADITVKNCIFTGRKQYSPGTYDIKMTRALNVTLENCTQSNDILDSTYWGIMVCHRVKQLTVKDCSFSRVDAHSGFFDVSIIGSTLGHQGLNAIGGGTLLLENSTVYGKHFVNLRSDYGSVWNGDLIVRGCTWVPNKGKALTGAYALIGGTYSGFHDFGYECGMPRTIVLENLHVDDSRAESGYSGIRLLGNIVEAWTGESYEKKVAAQGYPYRVTEKITVSGFTSASGKKWTLTKNAFMYRGVAVEDLDG